MDYEWKAAKGDYLNLGATYGNEKIRHTHTRIHTHMAHISMPWHRLPYFDSNVLVAGHVKFYMEATRCRVTFSEVSVKVHVS